MATSRKSVGVASAQLEDDDAFVYVFDRRDKDAPEVKIPTGGLWSYDDFIKRVRETIGIKKNEKFIVATTNREEIKDDPSWDIIDKGDTLYVLKNINQELCAPAKERVNFLPHYDTIVKGGMYEYYASEGQNPLPYAFAELIDNALSATSNNDGPRNIELRLYFDDKNPKENCLFVIDNGKGMTPRQLNNWAIYRLSKFIRKDKRDKVSFIEAEDEDSNSSLMQPNVPLSLNSDISYFGVGGKQAVFFIGTSTRMISKPRDSKDVHELTISKEEFQQKEINQEAIYSGFIHNRKPGDASHIKDDEILKSVIADEKNREHFTIVQIKNINPDHLQYLKGRVKDWTRQLAHIYHYYIHGPQGNITESSVKNNRTPSPFQNIDIQVKLFMPKQTVPQLINLRDIDDDMQTLYVRSGASVFDFKATVEGSGVVEGVIRYHPFLYDRETYPSDVNDPRIEPEVFDEHDYAASDRPARGRRPIFECYWNGRLIPYTFIEDFEWCQEPKKGKNLPLECYNRISGVLFTNDHFQVSTNKLTFIDLEMRLKEKNTVYHRISNGQEKRTAIDKEFLQFLKECHEHCDKQIHFTEFKGQVTRLDLPKQRQTPWAEYQQVEWDGKIYKKGQLVRITRTLPTLLGTINRFLLYGEYEGDVFATGGDLEVIQEPRSLYDDVKIVPLSKLDRQASSQLIKKYIDEEEAKLPSILFVSWPEGFEVKNNECRRAGETVGAIKIEIGNKKGETISKLPGNAASSKRLLVELKIIWHGPTRDEVIVSHISQYSKNWGYWFRKMENVRNLGAHTLSLQVVLNESGNTVYSGKELPSHKIKFTVTESDPEKFTVGMLDGPFRVGVPFQIPLEFQDEYGHPTKPTTAFTPVLEASGIDISYQSTKIKGNNLIITGCVAKGVVGEKASGKSFDLTVKIKQLEEASQTLKIRLLPGSPASLVVKEDKEIEIENGNPASFMVEVLDHAGNVTNDGKLICTCKFSGVSGLPTYSLDCSSVGFGKLTGEPLSLKKLKDFQVLTAKIELAGFKDVKAVERKVRILPSGRVSNIEVYHQRDNGKSVLVKEEEALTAVAGQTIQGLSFSLTDEAGRKVDIDDSVAAKIKVNWTPKTPKDKIIQGQLPDIRVPAISSDVKYCQISVQDGSGVDFNFVVSGKPAEPNQIKCKCEGFNVVRIGEVLESEIHVKVKDRFGNEISDLPRNTTSEFSVTGEGLNTEKVKVTQSKGTFVIRGVQFEGVKVGIKDVKVQWREHRDFVKIELAAGPPAKLEAPGWDLNQTVTVLNDNKLPRPLIVQVCDVDGNPCRVTDIRIQIARDPKIKLMPAPQTLKTGPDGSVNFGIFFVSGQRGTYEIEPRAMHCTPSLESFKISIEIQPDSTKPIEMKVEHGKKSVFAVGDKLPDITVSIMAEDGNKMGNSKYSSLSMKLWKVDNQSRNAPASRATSFSPEIVKNSPGEFVFKDRKFPEVAGEYHVLITYYDGKHELFSNVINFDVNPGKPSKLCPVEPPGTPTVSNTHNPQSRCLVRNTKFQLQDSVGNYSGQGYNGTLKLEICGEPGEKDLPCFVGGTKSMEIKFVNGECTISGIMLQENTSGRDGAEYILKCQLLCDKLPRNQSIPPYNITFLFYNDAKKQSQMASLSKHRDELQTVIRTYKSLFETTEQLIKELKSSVHEAQTEDTRLKEELRRQKIPLVQLQSVESVDRLIFDRTREREHIMTAPRRMCGLTQAPQEPQVLGKIGHLALVQDTDIARVLSWHMSSDMDCVVTFTTEKAKELYRRTDGKQQVLPLDSIYRKTLPDWTKPLPHMKHKRNWRPPGNPTYARDLLSFPKEAESCKIVFGMLLGDTLILDSIDSANTYRQELVKFCHCPTILTREGDRVRSNGKFGGLMNKALPIEKLRGAVFGEPLPSTFDDSSALISSIQNYKAALLRTQRAKEELQEQVDHMKDAEMQSKHKECREAEQQLKDIEYKLGVTMQSPRVIPQSRSNTRIQQSTPEETPSPSKRARTSASTPQVVSVTPTPSPSSVPSTPTRQSKRISSQTPGSNKRLRKT